MSEFWLDILIGAGASIVASFIWWFFTQLYSIRARNRINFLLINARDESIAYEKYLQYNDYDNALSTSQRIIDKLGEVYISIKPLTYFCRKKRLLINTLINNVYIMVNKFKSYHIGYEGEVEKQVCCERAFRHLYVVGYAKDLNNRDLDPLNFEPITSVSLKLLIDLNIDRWQSVEDILGKCFCFNGSDESIEVRRKKLHDLTEYTKPFNEDWSKSIAVVYHITTKVLKKKQYSKIVKNIRMRTSN